MVSTTEPALASRERVRCLLAEMLALESWGEKDRQACEQKLDALRGCVVDAASEVELQKLPKRMCAYEFKPGDIAWNCKVCQADETCVMCNDCFISSDHENHEVFFYYTHSGGCCDCGDTEAWAPEGFCTQHKGAQDVDPLTRLPPDLLVNARECLSEVMNLVLNTISEARSMCILQSSDLQAAKERLENSPPEAKYSLIVHYNELQTAQEIAGILANAHLVVAHQVLKIVNDMSSQKQSIVRFKANSTEALQLAETLYGHGIIVSIVSNEYKTKAPIVTSLLHWLVSLANLSDGLCRLVCEQFLAGPEEVTSSINEIGSLAPKCHKVLRSVILADSFLPKSESDALHSLLMALLADPLFKRSFAITFTSCYRQLYREFASGVGSSSVTILAFGVQFFNRASFVRLLVGQYELLDVLMSSVMETLRKINIHLGGVSFSGWERLQHFITPASSDINESTTSLASAPLLDFWDLLALHIQQSDKETLGNVDFKLLEEQALASDQALATRKPARDSNFFRLPFDTELPGRFEFDITSPVFIYRRYLSGLLDLRYALQIEGISQSFVLSKKGRNLTDFLLFLSFLQGVCGETRRFGDHVEMESRGWVVAVEFVSTASDVFNWIIVNVFKIQPGMPSPPPETFELVTQVGQQILEAFFFWLASSNRYFPPSGFQVGDSLRREQVETRISCHFPIHRTIAQLIKSLCDIPEALEIFYRFMKTSDDDDVDASEESSSCRFWVHNAKTPIGFWHRLQLMEPVLLSIVWDAQVHSGLWVRNGISVTNHSMNYGEPPFCMKFRDLDMLLVQFGFQILDMDWLISSILERFDVLDWSNYLAPDVVKETELMVTECLTFLCQLACELPPKVVTDDALRCLIPYLRREIVQRLCVGPCAHSDLSKIATEFFLGHENLFPNNFSNGAVLDQILSDICVPITNSGMNDSMMDSGAGTSSGKFQYRLRPELLAEYQPTYVHLTRKQHEFAHENWYHERIKRSRIAHQQDDASISNESWLDFPMVKSFLPSAAGFEKSRLSILHEKVCTLLYEALSRARTDAHYNLKVLSRAVTLLTMQVYVVEEIRAQGLDNLNSPTPLHLEAEAMEREYFEWITREQPPLPPSQDQPRECLYDSLLKLDPWQNFNREGSSLDGDQKHEIGRGIDWLILRLARLSSGCERRLEFFRSLFQGVSTQSEEQKRKQLLAQRKKEAQRQAMLRIQQQQAAFAEQMRMNGAGEGDVEDDESLTSTSPMMQLSPKEHSRDSINSTGMLKLSPCGMEISDFDVEMSEPIPECAMCHSDTSENSFMCHVGFAQCSAVFSRLNNGPIGPYLSTPLDEMHVGEDVPIHVRLCGHAVHHSCWKSYHASQFQRAITGGHHRHALNAVDVTKGEFLCPLCKSISNVLIPHTSPEMDARLECSMQTPSTAQAPTVEKPDSMESLLEWIHEDPQPHSVQIDGSTERELEEEKDFMAVAPSPSKEQIEDNNWLGEGLSSLCMAIHKVACGATERSRPERYTTSASYALFHTLLCTYLNSTSEKDACSKPELFFVKAMKHLPRLLPTLTPQKQESMLRLRSTMRTLVCHGGADTAADGNVQLEEQHPSTQTQTMKQSLWNKVRWPMKPLLTCNLGCMLSKSILLAQAEQEAVNGARWIILARLVQSLLWYTLAAKEDLTEPMNHAPSWEDKVHFFVTTFCESKSNVTMLPLSGQVGEERLLEAANQLNQLRQVLFIECLDGFPTSDCTTAVWTERFASTTPEQTLDLLRCVAGEMTPIIQIATFMIDVIHERNATASNSSSMSHAETPCVSSPRGNGGVHKPAFVTIAQARKLLGFVGMQALADLNKERNNQKANPGVVLVPILRQWVVRFRSTYSEMSDPQGLLEQWLLNANAAASKAQTLPPPVGGAILPLSFPLVLSRDLNTVSSALSVFGSGVNRMAFLRSLPRAYVKFYAQLAKRKCENCNQFPARPAVCLLCGLLLCAANTCPSINADKSGYPEESNPGACTIHTKKCGRGSGMFLLVLEGAVLLVSWKLAAYVGSLYVDEYGEEFGERNRDLNKGRPLYLSEERRERLLNLWKKHEIPNEVVRIQNSSERVIRNSHY